MKLCYLGCHGILEYDELRLFTQIEGLEWFSTGAYFFPNVKNFSRPALNFPVDVHNYTVWDKGRGKWNNPEFLDQFDVLYFMHRPEDVFDNWNLLKNRKIVWRTIGQSNPTYELKMQELMRDNPQMKVVRYSPAERRITNYAGENAMIRFSKEPSDYGPWNGAIKKVLTVGQSMKTRNDACNWSTFETLSQTVPCQLLGHNNADAGDLWMGRDSTHEELLQAYRDYGVYFYTGTKPASYCLNFIEAWMSGIPVVAIGPSLGNGTEDLYEVHELISYSTDGYWADFDKDLGRICKMLLEDSTKAKSISELGRARAIELFDQNKIKLQWEEFFKSL